MKKKLIMFANIIMICLSVCLLAFGVYSLNNASVKSGGRVQYVASGVNAQITRTVSGHDTTKGNVVTTETKAFNSSTTETLTFNDEIYFDNANEIVMTFKIENLSEERNLDFTFTKSSTNQNILDISTVSANMYDVENLKYNVNPKAANVKNSETITIRLNLKDANASGLLDYNYSISLSNQAKLKEGIADTTEITRFGNTYVATTTLSAGNQMGYIYAGTTDYFEYSPTTTDTNVVTSAIHVFGAGLTGITIKNETIDSTYKKLVDGKANLSAISSSGTYFPVVVNDSTNGVMVITSIGPTSTAITVPTGITSLPGGVTVVEDNAFASSSIALTSLPEGLIQIKENAFKGCTSSSISFLPGSLKLVASNALGQNCEAVDSSIVIPEGILEFGSSIQNTTTVKFLGTKTTWNEIVDLFTIASGTTINFLDGTSTTIA